MAQLVYIPDEDVKVHEEGAIRLICKAFQSHENGLPVTQGEVEKADY